MNDLVSIIIPVYNVEAYLKKCVDSVLAQTYTNIEVILVDDGSPDNCPSICDEYARIDSRIKVIHKENEGLSSARNAGLDVFTGEYVAFFDSDDRMEPIAIGTMLEAIQNHGADMCICRSRAEDENGTELLTSAPWTDQTVFSSEEILQVFTNTPLPKYTVCWNKLYRRSVFETLRFPVGLIHEDEYIMPHVYSSVRKIVCINDILFRYLVRQKSITHEGFSVRRFDIITAWLNRIQLYNSIGHPELAAITCERAADNYCAMIHKMNALSDIPEMQKDKIHNQKKELLAAVRAQVKSSLSLRSKIKLLCFSACYPFYLLLVKFKVK